MLAAGSENGGNWRDVVGELGPILQRAPAGLLFDWLRLRNSRSVLIPNVTSRRRYPVHSPVPWASPVSIELPYLCRLPSVERKEVKQFDP